jgi:predicted O-linked N-acetylglucosamine transferase (SPINDLY family)
MTVPEAFALALQHQRAGRLAEAETLYRQILAAHPNHPDALHLLGTIAYHVGRLDLALEWFQQSIRFNPAFSTAHFNLGNVLWDQKRFAEAIAAYRRAIELNPVFAEAHHNLGVALKDSGRPTEALPALQQALRCKPDYAEACNNLGLTLAELGQAEEAIAAFRRALALQPGFAIAHNNLGVALANAGRFDEAIVAYQRCLELLPEFAPAHNNLGNALKALGRPVDALARYRQALALAPDFAEAHNSYGIACLEEGRVEEAIRAYRQALDRQPHLAEAHNNLGLALRQLGQNRDATAAFRRALELKPTFAEAHNNLGLALAEAGLPEEALAAFREAIRCRPTYAEAHNNLGAALRQWGQTDEAFSALDRAVALRPDYAEAWNNLGVVLHGRMEFGKAAAAFQRAIDLQPTHVEAWSNLGVARKEQGRLDEAMDSFRRALALQPDAADALNNLASLLKDRGEITAAVDTFRRSLAANPRQPLVHSNLIYTLHFDPHCDDASMAAEQKRWNRQFADPFKAGCAPYPNVRDPNRRLRIGYVSPDLRNHVIGRNLLPLFQHHDRENFEIVCYAGVEHPDDFTALLRRETQGWHGTLGRSDEAVAAMVRQHEVDILVDLTQHLSANRLPIFARRPAPVQVSFAGYPESAGLEAIEYRMSDKGLEKDFRLLPHCGTDCQFGEISPRPEATEPTAWLPYLDQGHERVYLLDSFWCYDPCGLDVAVNELPAEGSGHITFGSLNHFGKVNEPLLALWARVLHEVKDARLIVLAGLGSHRQRTLNFLEQAGVAPGRVEFATPCPRAEYLALNHRLDIVLDSFPYNGHTTSLDALWMGVPVVTLAGSRAVSRAGLSQLSNLGLPELVAHSEEEYIAIATRLAADWPRLTELRRTLRTRMEGSVLMDAPHFARQIETAFRTMWRAWCTSPTVPS